MHDLKCTMNGEMLTRDFAERRGCMTEEEKEVEQIVGERLQKRIDEERVKGRAEGMIEGAMKVVVDMVRNGVISNFTQKMNEYLSTRG